MTAILWLRRDLRRADHPALLAAREAATASGGDLVVAFVGVDRLDYSKGLEERFLAYEQLLADHPDLEEQVFLSSVRLFEASTRFG